MASNLDQLASEARALVALAFRNGPIEDVHAGFPCPTCAGESRYSRISDSEMRTIMKTAVNRMYTLLLCKATKPAEFEALMRYGSLFTRQWDDPEELSFLEF